MSPSVGARRKGAKVLPKLPLSAFTPPNTGTSDSFPGPPSPSTLQPEEIVDVYAAGDLSQWKQEAARGIGQKGKGVVLSLLGKGFAEVEKELESIKSAAEGPSVIAVLVPIVDLSSEGAFIPPSYLASKSASGPVLVPSVVFLKSEQKVKKALHWALLEGYTINIDVQCDIRATEGGWDALEDLLASLEDPTNPKKHNANIIVSNILPPPDDLSLPIVKLLTHPSYRNYQAHTAALSLYANVFVSYLPPAWGVPTPPQSAPKDRTEWKKRIKMYISPAVEAFGFQRIVFGSSPSAAIQASSNVSDWYELARESFAELGIEQDAIDAVFAGNAKRLFS
ncbi:hypothetical protein DAEQUDRAFT_730852 [Daedalea quercina L-15889]|uniref:Amidohydrolase-related domain-containing protein n=1 Tax=Daedalea quercina L-15889 TaxID=1314783 RepID=A0A165MP22_9APHY|nr:hypothetical protein DAEQUDRAFT_730852 [Daedalea quercina L-15889]